MESVLLSCDRQWLNSLLGSMRVVVKIGNMCLPVFYVEL